MNNANTSRRRGGPSHGETDHDKHESREQHKAKLFRGGSSEKDRGGETSACEEARQRSRAHVDKGEVAYPSLEKEYLAYARLTENALPEAELGHILAATWRTLERDHFWYRAGQRLEAYRRAKLYKRDGYGTFRAFCHSIGIAISRADLLIGAVQVTRKLKEAARRGGGGYVPGSQEAAFALVGLSDKDLQVLGEELRGRRRVSLEDLKEVVLAVRGSLESTPLLERGADSALAAVSPDDVPFFDAFQQKSYEEAKVGSKRLRMGYAQRKLGEAGLPLRLLGNYLFAVEGPGGRVAYYWPVLKRWQWADENERKGNTIPEELIEALTAEVSEGVN